MKIKTVLQTTDGLIPAFKAAAAAKKGPDIQYFWGGIWSLDDAWLNNTKPVSDYIPKSELAHYLNAKEDTFDGKVWTAPWYVQPSFPVLYRKDVLAKAGVAVPTSWAALLKSCDQLNAKGITPIAGGIKDGWFGGWLFSVIGAQGITSISDVLDATTGKAKFTDPKLAAYWTRLQELRDHKCWNNDINSLELYQGQQRWSDGKAAMTVTAGSDVKKFVKQVGVAKVGVMAMPKWGNGPYAGQARLDLADRGHHRVDEVPRGGGGLHHVHAHPGAAGGLVQDHGCLPGRQPVQHEADHAAAAEGAVQPRQERLSVPGELHPAGAGCEGLLRPVPARCSAAAPRAAKAAAATEKVAQRIRRRSGSRWRTSRRGQLVPLGPSSTGVGGRVTPGHRRSRTTEETAQVPPRPLRAAASGSPLRSRSSSFVFGYSMFELVKSSFQFDGAWTTDNFHITWTDPTFRTALGHNARLLLAVPILVAGSLLLSILLFEGLRGWRFHRWALFLPYVLAIPVIGVVFGQLLQFNGLINQVLRAVGLGGLAQDWLGQPRWALWTMTAVIVWRELGFGIILFLARLLSVPSDVFEAGRMDGARFFRLHRRITIPQLSGVIVFYVVVEAITMVSWVFNYVYVMTNGQGGPGDATQVTELYIYQSAFQYQSPEIASAAAATLFAVTLVLIAPSSASSAASGIGIDE